MRTDLTLLTERLQIIALTADNLDLLISDIPSLEKKLKIKYDAEPICGEILSIFRGQLEITQNDVSNYIWHTFWLIVRRSDGVCVGSIDFKNMPDENGEVEIGYGLGKKHEHNGYMTEAVLAMCGFAFSRDGVKHIIAETELDNIASQNVLKRCGFVEYKRDKTVWWRL